MTSDVTYLRYQQTIK